MLNRIQRIGYLFVVCILCMAAVQHVDAAGLKYKSGKHYKKYSGKKYTVYFEGNQVTSKKLYGIKLGDELLVPYKKVICKGMNIAAAKGRYKKTAIIAFVKGNKRVLFFLNNNVVVVNNTKKRINTAPRYCKIKKKVVYVPLDIVAETFGYTCDYYEADAKVSVYKPAQVKAKKKTAKKTSTAKKPAAAKKTTTPVNLNIQSTMFKTMTPIQFIAVMGPIAKEDYRKTGILASVTLAQAINESGWGKTKLCQASNNMFGMKCSLSGNTWAGSVWDQRSYVAIRTTEEYGGKKVKITAKFRRYPNVAFSVADHSAYLRYARNGSGFRYAGITGTKSYVRQLKIIQKGGYCTWSSYISELTSIIKKYNLTVWDQ